MVKIVVSEDQAKAIAEAKDNVEIVDQAGNRLGFFVRPFDQACELIREGGSHSWWGNPIGHCADEPADAANPSALVDGRNQQR